MVNILKINLVFIVSIFTPLVFAEELIEFKFDIPPRSMQMKGTKPVCEFSNLQLPNDVIIYAAGGYSGRKTDYQIDQSGHIATQFDIAVNSPGKPVVLLLGAYEPTIWNIGWSQKTKIVAVLVSGYHRQVIAGLKSSVPLLISSYHNKGACGHFYVGKGRNNSLNPMSRKLFNKSVDLVFPGDRSGKIVIGEPLEAGTKLMSSSENPPESYRDTTAPPAGKAGLDDAVRKGVLRHANEKDADDWVAAIIAGTPEPDVPPIAGRGIPKPPKPRLRNAYVVLKPFTYPAGLYGGHSATFFISKGVAKPAGNPGHSVVFDFNSFRCLGVGCGR